MYENEPVVVFLIRSYGIPNGAGQYSIVHCYDKTWAILAQSKMVTLVIILLDFTDRL